MGGAVTQSKSVTLLRNRITLQSFDGVDDLSSDFVHEVED